MSQKLTKELTYLIVLAESDISNLCREFSYREELQIYNLCFDNWTDKVWEL